MALHGTHVSNTYDVVAAIFTFDFNDVYSWYET